MASKPEEAARSNDLGEGVYYLPADYLGLLRRWAIIALDLPLVLLLGLCCWIVESQFQTVVADTWFVLAWLVFSWLYLVLLKMLSIRTVGYRLLGAKVVDLNGRPPSLPRLTFRLLLTLLGIGNPLLDLAWMDLGRHRQTFRDKLAGTYVVREEAQPIGKGPIQHTHLFVMGYSFLYRQVQIQALAPVTKFRPSDS